MKRTITQRILCTLLCAAMLLAYLPAGIVRTSAAAVETVTTVADPETLTRPETIYGDSTVNAGKITVGKSVSDQDITVNGQTIELTGENNFLVTISQSAQVMGLTTQTSAPVDVVIVLDNSSSMGRYTVSSTKYTRLEAVTDAANKLIAQLLENESARLAVVTYSTDATTILPLNHYEPNDSVLSVTIRNRPAEDDDGGVAVSDGDGVMSASATILDTNTSAGTKNDGYQRGTNMQSGINQAGTILNAATNAAGRVPFVIVLTDGVADYAATSGMVGDTSDDTYVMPSSNTLDAGVILSTLLNAAYWKYQIGQKYGNEAVFHTVGVDIGTDSEANVVMDPANYFNTANTNAVAANAYSWYTSWSDKSSSVVRETTGSGGDGRLNGNSGTTYTWTFSQPDSTTKSGIIANIGYSDKYHTVSSTGLTTVFDAIMTDIVKKSITTPTKVTTGDHNFDGYVNFYDTIGEYMDVKDVKGILAGGYFYQGASFAQRLENYGTANADEEFDELMHKVLKTRMGLSNADDRFESEAALDQFIDELLIAARNSSNQANYVSSSDFDNSIVWWGNAHDSGEEDEHVQMIGFADNDSIEYIEQQLAAGSIPEGADYVCRSYFFYGEAGGTNPNPDHEYLYFMVRVQRELTFPYRQTVVISAPASLLSMEKVLINETFGSNGDPVYTATVTHQEPARVVYEVGLWDTITPENVSLVVSSDYTGKTVNGQGSVNYDEATNTYNFFTNEWDRSQSLSSHHRAMAKATFDAAEDNGFYTYQSDTLLVDAAGNAITSDPTGSTAYYVREYYEWTADSGQDGTYSAVKKTTLVEVDIPEDATLIQKSGNWYIPEGTYTAATLVVNGDDTIKDDPTTEAANDGNKTGTSSVVAHPHRTGDADNSHYTVLLGNNGMLSLVAEPYEPVKTVSVNLPANAASLVDGNGKAVQVGDVLTYTVEVKNILTEAADITVTDYIPLGTEFVSGSAGTGNAKTGHTKDASIQPDSNNVLTWVLKDVPANATRYVSFQVTVLKSAMSLNVVSHSISNTAQVQIGNNPAIQTNTTQNPPYGKTVTGVNGVDADGQGGYKVGDILVYHIRVTNDAKDSSGNAVAADVTVTDHIPQGTTYVEGSADNGGTYADGVVTWKFTGMAAGEAKVVSFRVKIDASAKSSASGTQSADGEITLSNTATIQVGSNNPQVTTNTTVNMVDVGDMVITKVVAAGGDQSETFTIRLSESTGLLSGTYVLDRSGKAETVVFQNGKASVTIQHGQTLTVKGLPAGVIISVAEDVSAMPGWTPAYNTQSVTVTKGAATAVSSVSVTNTYTRKPLTLTLKGVKIMSGAALSGDVTFGFLATPYSTNPEVGDPLTGEVTVDGNGEFVFSMFSKTFTKPGVYKYSITEINGGVPGVNYDATVHVLEINVIDNGDGTMRAEGKLNDEAFDMAGDTVSFSNSYAPKETQVVFTAGKEMTGRKLTAGEFSFQLSDGTNVYKGIQDADGSVVFPAISFKTAGTYTYTMSEVVPASKAQGVTYDTGTYRVVVEVTDDGGQLVPTVTVEGVAKSVVGGTVDTGIVFRNSFEPEDVPLKLTAKKTLLVYNATTGTYAETAPEADKFRFQIKDEAGETVAIGYNDASGLIQFETVYFSADMLKDVAADASGTKTKTFIYTLCEVVPSLAKDPNMKYDTEGKQVAVTLTLAADGTLTVTVGNDSDGNVDLSGSHNFINYGNPDTVSVSPAGMKTTNGENLPAGLSFSFQVVPVDGNGDAAIGTSNTTQGGGISEQTGITFTTLVYTHESLGDAASRTFRYWIMESNAGAGNNGVIYDTTRYLYQVTLSRDTYGRLVAQEAYFALKSGGDKENASDYTVAITESDVQYTNTYHAKAHINLTATKELTGRNAVLEAGEFDFVLHRLDARGRLVPGSEISGYNDAAGVIHFATLNYANDMLDEAYKHSDGAFYFSYLLQELKPEDVAVPGVTYDTAEYVVTIKVTQDSDDGMTAELANVSKAVRSGDAYAPGEGLTGFTADGDTNVTFTNVYQPTEGDVVKYQIRKELDGRDIRPGEFAFGLYLDGELHDVATNDENGIVTFFRTIPASAGAHAGTYEMVIKELKGSVSGVTYSGEEYTIYVKVQDNGEGKIEATVHLTEDGEALPEDAAGMVDLTDTFVFHNTYEAHDAIYLPTAGKELTGRDQTTGEFSFQVQQLQNGQPVPDAVYKGINDANGNIHFESIRFTEEGTYLYRLSEDQGASSGVSYDASTYYLLVRVVDDGSGHLKATGAYYTDGACTDEVSQVIFRNTYTTDGVAVQLKGEKELIGRELADREFSFVVHKESADGPIVATGSNDAAGSILFSTFDITAADLAGEAVKTFRYVIVESNNKLPGVTYASAVEVTVTVTNDDGVLSAVVAYPQGDMAKFVNTYTPNPVELPLAAFKTLTGKNLLDGEFRFLLKDASGKVLQTATNGADGHITFRNLVFTHEDMVDGDGKKVMSKTFVYTLSEEAGDMPGMAYDDAVYTVTVTVTDDGEGNLTASASYLLAEAPVELLRFANTYTPPVIEVELEGTKTIVDSDGNVLTGSDYPLEGFEFQVFDADGKVVANAASDASGVIRFTGFRFAAAGEYRFTISEKTASKPGYATDPTIWCAHITIGYDADTGTLYEANAYIHIAPETHDEGMARVSEELNFVNVYDPADVTLTIKGLKKLEGRELKEHEFTFYMVDKATNLRAAESRNRKNGEISFHLTYTKTGTYTYTVYEEIPADQNNGVTYTTKTHEVTVEVVDDGTGALKAKVGQITVADAGVADLTETVVFVNTYAPDSAAATVEAWKYLDGKDLAAGDFTFELVSKENAGQRYTAVNDADGRIVFDALTFRAEDLVDAQGGKLTQKVFAYTLREIPGSDDGIIYDEAQYTVLITVTDDGTGKLSTAVQYRNDDGKELKVPTFRNACKDQVAKKEAFLVNEPSVNIDGNAVKTGDVLTYVVTYKNYTGKAVDVTVTDKIPAYTEYVEGSADHDGVLSDGVLTWKLTAVAPNAEVSVSFRVKVTGSGVELVNRAQVLEGRNTYETNTVTNPVENPPSDNPQTGDTQLAKLIGLMAFSALGLVTVLAVLVKSRKKGIFE